MEIRRHPQCTRDIGAPSDMTSDECNPLPVMDHQDESGPWTSSFWMPDSAELAALNAGGSVVLSLRVGGRQHPVVQMQVTPDATESL